MKKLLTHLPKAMLLLFVMLVFVQVNAQKRYAPLASSDFEYTIQNDYQVSTTKLRFDLYIRDTDPSQPFELSQIQAGVLINKSITTGTLSAAIVTGSSQLVAAMVPTAVQIAASSTPTQWCVQLASKTPPPCGSGTIISSSGIGTRVCTIEITASVAFTANSQAGLLFNYTISPYPTKVFMRQACVGVELTCNTTNSKRGDYWIDPLLNPTVALPVMKTIGPTTNFFCNSASLTIPTSETGVTYALYKDGVDQLINKTGNGATLTWAVTGEDAGALYKIKAFKTATPTAWRWMLGDKMVTNTPVVTFDPIPAVCEGSMPLPLNSFASPEYGVFSGEGVAYSPSTLVYSFDASATSGPGMSYDVTYVYTKNTCASEPAIQPVWVEALPVIVFDAPVGDFCVGQIYDLTPYATPAGGVFSGLYVSGNNFAPTAPGLVDITYSYVDPVYGCVAVPVTQPFNVIICTPPVPTWTGLVSTDWNNPGNWLPAVVPLPTDNALIPGGCPNYPVLLSGFSYMINDLDISGFGVKAPLAGSFTIYGELVVSGNLTISSTGALIIGGGGALTVTGNLTISGSMTVQTNGSLITNGSVTGQASIEREITANMNWHLLSSPVTQQYICNGVFAPHVPGFPGVDWDFYKWWANCPTPPLPAEHWRNLRNSTGGLNEVDFGTNPGFQPVRGYLVAYGPLSGMPTTKVFTGVPSTGDKIASFFDIFTECTWDLPGNPFPSAIDWNLVTGKSSLVTDFYYVWNELKAGGPGYEFSDGTLHSSPMIDGFIPSMQGFFVKVQFAGSRELQIPNSARAHHFATSWLKDNQPNKLTVKLGNATNYDEAFVMFGPNYNAGKDRKDAEKLFSMSAGIPQIYTIVDNDMKTALNSMSFIDNGTTIPVGIVAPAEGTYTITVSGIETFGSLAGLSLEDKDLNYTQNLLQNPVYTFTATGNEDADRFLLHFAGPIGIGEKSNSVINIYSNEKSVYVTCAAGFKNAIVTISNLLGQEIVSQKLNDQPMNEIKVNALKGYYIVKVQNESSVKTAKVYIN